MNKTNKLLMVSLLFLVVSSLVTSKLAQQGRDNRSKATDEVEQVGSEVVNGVCGAMNNTSVTNIPDNRYACAKGAVNWMDSVADDGAYNWDCIGKIDGVIAHCEALLEK